MYNKEIIYYSDNKLIEKIAHESAMASAIAEFNQSFSRNGIKPTHEAGYIVNLYYQHKQRVLCDLINNYAYINIDDKNVI